MKRQSLVDTMREKSRKWGAEAERHWRIQPTLAAAYRVKAMTFALIADAYEKGEEGYL